MRPRGDKSGGTLRFPGGGAAAIQQNGLEAAQYQVALKQVEALNALGNSPSSNTVLVPANALEAFGNAFNMLKGKA